MTKLVRTSNTYPTFDIFNDFFNTTTTTNKMKTDILEVENGYELLMDIPGFDKNDIKISLEKGYMNISVSKEEEKEEKDKKYLRRERYSGYFQRSFYVGDEIAEEDIKANFENGVLKLFVPNEGSNKAVTKYIDIL